jgi:hypothetical protein
VGEKVIPRAVRGLPPWDDPAFIKIESSLNGLPDGVHTGGCWSDGVEVWKPLDGGNAHDGPHYPTQEAECLEEMTGEPGFPRNWRVEEVNGRRWLVRKKAYTYDEPDVPVRQIANVAGFVESAVRALNAKGWELGDSISIAYDLDLGVNFILDLSCARPTYRKADAWDDEWRLERWWEENGYDNLLRFRQAARHVVTSLENHDRYEIPRGWRWVYASRHRPLSLTWARKLRGRAVLVPHRYDTQTRVHTWAVAEGELDEETVYDYELVLGWWPWDTPARRKK